MATKTLAILGVGMMGGSIGLAAKKQKLPYRILGIGRNLARLASAKKQKICDDVTTDLAQGAREADLLILCTTVNQIVPSFKTVYPNLKPGAIVTDIGSVKSIILEGVRETISSGAPSRARFIGSHPLAGSEKTGFEHANPDLYRNASVVLCPESATEKPQVAILSKFWKSLGANPIVMEPQIHDLLVSETSHLPHVLASALVQIVSGLNRKDERTAKLLAGSFRDMTRIADSDPKQWAEISAANQKFLIGAIKSYRDILLALLKELESTKTPVTVWENYFSKARAARQKLLCPDKP